MRRSAETHPSHPPSFLPFQSSTSPPYHPRLQQTSRRSGAMALRKRAAAVPDPEMTTQAAAKRSRTSIGSTDEYEEVTCLGQGGFGVVFKARHRATGKTVAIKFLSSPEEAEEGLDVAELLREARFLEACSGNPYVVGFEGLARHHTTGKLCLLMEFAAAPSLRTLLWNRRHGMPLPEAKVRAFMWKLLTGIKMMHDRHIVHRDIKPGNILVGQNGELLKICDLGLAISLSESPPYGQAGTLPYMAPEMLLHKPDYDAQVDNWSLGCVMGEMLTGKTLFHDDDDEGHQDVFNDTDHIVQLWSVFRLLGMPDDRTWPEFTSLPLTAKAQELLPDGHKDNRLREMFPEEKLSEQGFDVLQGLLTCNPDKRLTAAKALKHPWFSAPRPSAATAEVQTLPLPTKKRPRFVVPLAVLKAQRV